MLDLDADGYEITGDSAMVHGAYAALEALQDGLRQQGWEVLEWSHAWHPLTNLEIKDPDMAQHCLKLLDTLESLDDVRSVSANIMINEDLAID